MHATNDRALIPYFPKIFGLESFLPPLYFTYFIVALAGGLVSVAIIKHETGTDKFWDVLEDSLLLIVLAIVVLFVAAVIEVYVTPVLF